MPKYLHFSKSRIIGSNLLLGEKTVRTAEGGAEFRTQNSLAKTGETAWALLRNAHSLSSSKSFSSFKVGGTGIEPVALFTSKTRSTN